MRILIIGCGKLGVATASLLTTAGHDVIAMRRQPQALPDWLNSQAVDVLDPSSLAVLPALDADVIIYQATPAAFSEAAYRDIYATGVRNVVSELQGSSATLLLVSSTGVYHQADGSWVDETSDTNPDSFSGRMVLEGERNALSMGNACVVRLSGIYGSSRLRLIERARSGDWSTSDKHWTNRIHEVDAARALAHIVVLALHARNENKALPPIWLASDSEPAQFADVMSYLATELGVTEHEVAPQDTSQSAKQGGRRAGSKRCSNQLLLASGFTFKYPDYRIGYGKIIQELPASH